MKILFVCTGNTCRSPMAEGIFRKIARDKDLPDVHVASAGIFADDISHAAENAIKVCHAMGVDISGHVSQSIHDCDLESVDRFVVMTEAHRSTLTQLGVAYDKIYVLGGQVDDPLGGDLYVYEACRDQIYRALLDFVDETFFRS